MLSSWVKLQSWLLLAILFINACDLYCEASALCLGSITTNEYSALQDLYDSTNGVSWTFSNGTKWSFPSSLAAPCSSSWEGVNCTTSSNLTSGAECSISGLTLTNFNMSGTLPSSLRDLTNVLSFQFEYNYLKGSFPTQITSLQNIHEFSVSYNNMTGTLPTELGLLTSLQILRVANNLFVGHLPSELGLMTGLIKLYAYGNSFNGSIPSTLGRLTNLQKLYLDTNSLEGHIPATLSDLVQLQRLYLYNNKLTGAVPVGLAYLTSLQKLWLSKNNLNGTIASDFCNLPNLQFLDLGGNKISGSIPEGIGNMTAIQELLLYSNRLRGIIPRSVGRLSSAVNIVFEGNFLHGTIPTEFGNLTQLINLNLAVNRLNQTIPSQLARMQSLSVLVLTSNRLSGTIPTEIGNLTALSFLGLDINNLTGTIPVQLYQLYNLSTLFLNGNWLSGSVSSQIGMLSNLTSVNLNFNNLTSTLPSELITLTRLQNLQVGNNHLNGTIATGLGALSGLQSLFLDYNSFSGTIPSELGQLRATKYLYLRNNRLWGTIPTELGRIEGLRYFLLGSNSLHGTIPSQLGNAKHITYLDVSQNSLHGSIPTELNQLINLQYLTIDANALYGHINVSNLDNIRSLNVSGNYFSGSIPLFSKSLSFLDMSSNKFTGSIEDKLSPCKYIRFIDLSHNDLVGSIPSYFSQYSILQAVNLSHNHFTGSIEPLAITSPKNALQLVDVSNNKFAGTLPGAVFNQPLLHSVIAYKNCFHGTLPEQICENKNMRSLILSMLSSSCYPTFGVKTVLTVLFSPDFLDTLMGGSIPSCLWELSELKQLHLFGNRLTGSIGELSNVSKLDALVLASNKLDGHIPISLQRKGTFNQLDLSFNKLSGTLSPLFNVSGLDETLYLYVNRLSGDIPQAISVPSDVNILDGNLFQCSVEAIPQNDRSHFGYVCGSSNLNSALYFAFAAFSFSSLVIYFIIKGMRTWFAKRLTFQSHSLFKKLRLETRTIVVIAMVEGMLGCIIYYVLKKVPGLSDFNTHTEQYFWTISAAYLHGWLPVYFIAVFLVHCLYRLVRILKDHRGKFANPFKMVDGDTCANKVDQNKDSSTAAAGEVVDTSCSQGSDSIKASKSINLPQVFYQYSAAEFTLHTYFRDLIMEVPTRLTSSQMWIRSILMHVGIFIVVVSVNVAYVVVSLDSSTSREVLFGMQFILSMFKVLWNALFIPWLVPMWLGTHNELFHRVFISLFSSIGAPLISTLFSSGNCFSYLITGMDNYDTSVQLPTYSCRDYCDFVCANGNCIDKCENVCGFFGFSDTVLHTDRPWMYSYQCSSALVTEFVPVLINSSIISGALIPLIGLMYLWPPLRIRERLFPTVLIKKHHTSANLTTQLSKLDIEKSSNVASTRFGNIIRESYTKDLDDSDRLQMNYFIANSDVKSNVNIEVPHESSVKKKGKVGFSEDLVSNPLSSDSCLSENESSEGVSTIEATDPHGNGLVNRVPSSRIFKSGSSIVDVASLQTNLQHKLPSFIKEKTLDVLASGLHYSVMEHSFSTLERGFYEKLPLMDPKTITVRVLTNMAIMLTFGIASPVLAAVAAVQMVSLYVYWYVLVYRYGNLQLNEKDFDRDEFITKRLNLVQMEELSTQVMVISLYGSMFWALFFFDMIGDVYGGLTGFCVALIPFMMLLLVWIFLQVSRTDRFKANVQLIKEVVRSYVGETPVAAQPSCVIEMGKVGPADSQFMENLEQNGFGGDMNTDFSS